MANRLVQVAVPEPIDYEVAGHTITFLGDFEGVMKWMTPGSDGRVEWIQPGQVAEFLSEAVAPASADALAAALDELGERAAYTMAETVWRNCQHLSTDSAAARFRRLTDAIDQAKARADEREEVDADAVPTSA